MNLGELISEAAKSGLLLSGGGHAMAAGLSMDPARLDELREHLEERVSGAAVELAEARVLEIDGALAPGARADICIFDPAETWPITAQTLRSQGKNTPFLGHQLSGRVKTTLVGGRVVFES